MSEDRNLGVAHLKKIILEEKLIVVLNFYLKLTTYYSQRLSEESLWSRTTYLYFQLAFTLMSTTSKEGLDEIAGRVPKYQLKIGKS